MRTCKDGDFIDIMKLSESLPLEARPQICHKYLGSLKKAHFFVLVPGFVTKAGKGVDQQVDEFDGRLVRLLNAVCEFAIKSLPSQFGLQELIVRTIPHRGSYQPLSDTSPAYQRAVFPH